MEKRHARIAGIAGVATALVAIGGCAGPAPFRGFTTSDGFRIAADLHVPPAAVAEAEAGGAGAPLIVLGHPVGRDRRAWDPLVPRLVEKGWAVIAVDHRAFGESTREAASPGALTEPQRAALYLDLLEAIDAAGGEPGVDTSRVAIVGGGLSTNAAVRCAMLRPTVRSLVLFTGVIEIAEEDWLLEHPEMPVLLLAAAEDRRGTFLARQYASRITGPDQRYLEIEAADPEVSNDWVGTDGLHADTGLDDLLIWRFERTFAP
jgi:pimeloyl-ACP methyl ester carboxylesterase